jgi:hypothetical protein
MILTLSFVGDDPEQTSGPTQADIDETMTQGAGPAAIRYWSRLNGATASGDFAHCR